MKYSKKLFSVIAMILCFSLCMGTVSHAQTIIKYKEISYGKPINSLTVTSGFSMRINSSGRLEVNLYDYGISKAAKKAESKKVSAKSYKRYARVTFDSKGKKKTDTMIDVYPKSWYKNINGTRAYRTIVKDM